MKKGMAIGSGLIVLILIIVGGYMLFHKSPKATPPSSSSSSTVAAVNNAVLSTKSTASTGQYLTDSHGNALYTYSSDMNNMSMCMGSCLASWPAYIDTGATTGLPTNVGTITRSDNNKPQYTYKGKPLYTFVGDSNGSMTGNGLSGFQVAKP
jgi:predicted lipoprotein with Yx(FWY)xxD motif